jgi:ribonuclease-3
MATSAPPARSSSAGADARGAVVDAAVVDAAVLRAELAREQARLQDAERICGHTFADRALLLSALTHSSLLNERAAAVVHNEVLELLGDAVLGLVVMESLVDSSPDAREGELTQRRAAHVSAQNLARAARRSGLLALLRTGRSVGGSVAGATAPDQVPDNVAADLVEAVLGAVHRDGGLQAARAAVARLLGPPPQDVALAAESHKRLLQERLQGLLGQAPSYTVARADGPSHAPRFTATVQLHGVELGEGEGGSKRTATEAAAQAAWQALAALDDGAVCARFAASPRGRR